MSAFFKQKKTNLQNMHVSSGIQEKVQKTAKTGFPIRPVTMTKGGGLNDRAEIARIKSGIAVCGRIEFRVARHHAIGNHRDFMAMRSFT